MESYIKDQMFLNEEAIIFGNDIIEAMIVPALGSNLLSLKSKKKDVDILRTPKSLDDYKKVPILYGMPILFPPNRIEDGTFTYKETTYTFPVNEWEKHNHIHGFLHDKPWKVLKREAGKEGVIIVTEFMSSDFPSMYPHFPHEFKVNMTYIVKEERLDIQMNIHNIGRESFPWGAGYHTIFNFPLISRNDYSDCEISLPVNKQWELNGRSLPTGKYITLPNKDEIQRRIIGEGREYDDIFSYDEEKNRTNEAILTDPKAGIQVRYQADCRFKYWVVFNEDGFLCPEPYTWITNAPNLKLPVEVTGLQELQPGESIHLDTKIILDEI
ncbi:aldose 1-epimerase [Peribacillus sp. NPDC097197]|uniref:aldose 1-epimerase n=1 Tax=Peribacillus sp. NPDC097197 TaxID=3390615 RepID=UPI003D082DC8